MKLSINIDMGAKNNGVFIATLKGDKIISKNTANVFFNKGLEFSKINRTAKRHTRRGYDRDRFILRLLGEILDLNSLSQSEKEKLFGLFKNRGFNYKNIDSEINLDDETIKFLQIQKGYKFGDCVSLNDFEKEITKHFESFDKDYMLNFLQEQREILENIIKTKKDDKSNKIKKDIKSIIEIFNSTENEIEKNNKHRISYLKDIKEEIDRDFDKIYKKFSIFKNSNEFYNFVGNISNFQTRILRKYFNQRSTNTKFDFKEDDDKLKNKIIDNINYTNYLLDTEKQNEKKMKEELKNNKALDFLKNIDPEITIPPYENRKNKNPQICNSMLINYEKIDEKIDEKIKTNLKNAIIKILANDNFINLKSDENGEIKYNDIEGNEAKYLQRILDISKAKLSEDTIHLYPRNLIKKENIEIFGKEMKLNQDELSSFVDFAKKYYIEIDNAKKGIINEDILKPCGKHTPHKYKNKHELISALFMRKITKNEYNNLENFLKENKIGNLTYKGFFEDLSELKKSYQNGFYKEINDAFDEINNKIKIDDKKLQKILKNCEEVATKIQNHNSTFSFKLPFNKDNLNTNFNYLSQLGDIVFSEKNNGFLKTCKNCTLENLIRSGGEIAMASRLPSNSARLINGKIEMYLDRLAYEITKLVDLENIQEVEINLEMNKFNFEESASEIELTKKRDKEKDSFICPYSGESITENDCEYDHILPRSKGIYNSLANLIPAHSIANSEKRDKKYTLDNLNEKYLKDIYKKINVKNLQEFKKFIDENIDKINEDKFTNFKNLDSKEQIAFRHALFLGSGKSFEKALRLLKLDKIRTHSNGTQKRLVNLLIKKLKEKNDKLNFSANFIDSMIISATRNDLCEYAEDENFKKKDKQQDSHSHCIDASVVFHCVNSKSISAKNSTEKEFIFDYFKDIYIKESEKIIPESKKYLELQNNQIARKKLFDDSVYSLVYENAENLKDEEKKFLQEKELLHTRKNGKNIPISKDMPLPKKFYITTNKVFELIFKAFKDKDIVLLEKLQFVDNHLKSYKREDIFDIFFNKNDLKKIENDSKTTKNIVKFYTILKENENSIINIKVDENGKETKSLNEQKVKDLFEKCFYTKKPKRARNKNRVIYSLPIIAKDANYIIHRNNGFAGLKNADIATKAFWDLKESKLVKISFFSKNILPLKIKNIIEILNLGENIKSIYKLKITRNLPSAIKSLEYTISQAKRHEVKVVFNKEQIDISTENIAEFLETTELKKFLGKARDGKINILKDSKDILYIKYSVQTTSSDNEKVIENELKNETSNS